MCVFVYSLSHLLFSSSQYTHFPFEVIKKSVSDTSTYFFSSKFIDAWVFLHREFHCCGFTHWFRFVCALCVCSIQKWNWIRMAHWVAFTAKATNFRFGEIACYWVLLKKVRIANKLNFVLHNYELRVKIINHDF